MKIIIVGIGKVGMTVAEELTAEKHDVTVVDTNEAALSAAVRSFDVLGVKGNGASHKVLSEAGVEECDLLIAITDSDEVNLLCCLLANKMGAGSTIARVRSPEYNEELHLLKEGMGLSMAVNPDRDAAAEIYRLLMYPSAVSMDSFYGGRIRLASFIADKNCSLCRREIRHSFAGIKSKALACAVERGNEVFIPTGSFVIEENDVVAVLAQESEMSGFFEEIGLPSVDIHNVMLVGGGRIAYYLAGALDRLKMDTVIIEKKPETAEKLSQAIPRAHVICGDGTDRALLLEEGLRDTDAICSLTGIDEENLFLSVFAHQTVQDIKTVAKVNRMDFQEIVRSLDIGSVVYPKYATASRILQHVRGRMNSMGGNVETLYKIINNKAEAISFKVGSDSALIGRPIGELKLRNNLLIGGIERNGRAFIPHGKDDLRVGDSVIVVTTVPGLTDLDDIKG